MGRSKEINCVRPFLCFMILIVSTITTQAQRYPFFNLNVESGLIQSQATAIVQDKFGHLWIGTLGGLSRYDGKNFNNYTVRDGMMTNTVYALATDKRGNIWIGTDKGLSQYDGKQFRHYIFQAGENPGNNTVTQVVVLSNGTVWCRAGIRATGKVYTITNGKSKEITVPNEAAGASTLLADSNALWIAKRNGVIYHYQNDKWDSLTYNEPSLTNPPVTVSMYKDSRKKMWLGTNSGLYTIEEGKIRVVKYRGQNLYSLPTIRSICEDLSGTIWFGTSAGAFRYKDSSFYSYAKRNGLTDNTINQVMTDAEGNVWLASDGQGVFRFSGAQFTVLDESMALPSAQVMSITAAGNKIYLGTYDAGLYLYEDGKVYTTSFPLKAPAPAITALKSLNGELWLGTRGAGLWRYNTVYKTYTYPTILSNSVFCMYKDTSGKLWIGFDNGAMVYNHDHFETLPLQATQVQDILSIGYDSMLLATSDGIKLFSNDSVYEFRTNSAPDSAFIQCFTKKGNELWIGTSDNGVICYNMATHTSTTINKANGLRSDFIYNIVADNEGNIWVGTGFGIHKISMAGGQPVISFYGKGQGISGMESNHNAVYKMPDGSIWFGTTNGALHYYPKSKLVSSKPISVIMQSVKVFGESITDSSYYDSTDAWYNVPYNLHLPYRKNNVTFTFQAISLSGADQVKYRYKIDGLDAQWSDWSSVNTVTYSALPPGKYTLRVDCIADNNGNISELSYPFEIITPFHKTRWFSLAILGACILLGVTIQYIANRRKQNRLALLERLRREEQGKIRQRTAEDFHDEVGNKLTRINVLTNVLQKKMGYISPESKRILEQIQDNTSQLYSGTRDILWSLKPSNDNLYEIVYRIRDFGVDLFQDTQIEFDFYGDDDNWRKYRLPLDVSRNLIMIFKEALNNCLKYSGATKVKLEVQLKEGALQLVLTDNGKGFDMDTVQRGHGIDNMNVRSKRINGILYIDTWPDRGTIITLTFKLPENLTSRG